MKYIKVNRIRLHQESLQNIKVLINVSEIVSVTDCPKDFPLANSRTNTILKLKDGEEVELSDVFQEIEAAILRES